KQIYFYDYAKHFTNLNILGQVLFEQRNTYFLPPERNEVPKELIVRKLMKKIFAQAHLFTVGLTMLMAFIQFYYLQIYLFNWQYYFGTMSGFGEAIVMQL